MQTFKTLLLREWMQHQRGWLVLLALPLLLVLGLGLFGDIKVDLPTGADAMPPLGVAMMTIIGAGGLALVLAWAAALLQAPGLARRDVQDRSIEFWLSLPISHAQGVGAPLLMHLVLWPWIALLVGLGTGALGSLLTVAKAYDPGTWFTLPWGTLLPAVVLLALRLMLGTLLATLWLSPLILGTMAASAWLKRWGLPVVVGGVVGGGLLLERLYGITWIWDTLRLLGTRASQALMAADRSGDGPHGFVIEHGDEISGALSAMPGWLLHDAGNALALLASPAFAAALAGGALAFGALWLRRARGA